MPLFSTISLTFLRIFTSCTNQNMNEYTRQRSYIINNFAITVSPHCQVKLKPHQTAMILKSIMQNFITQQQE